MYVASNEPIRLYFYAKKGNSMEKLQLSNGEQIEILNGATENSVKVEVETQELFLEIYNKLTDDNLAEISYLNESGVLCAIDKDKTLYKAELETVTDEETEESKLIATFTLRDIDTTKIKLKELQETVDTLVLNTLGINVASTEQQEEGEADETDIDETL